MSKVRSNKNYFKNRDFRNGEYFELVTSLCSQIPYAMRLVATGHEQSQYRYHNLTGISTALTRNPVDQLKKDANSLIDAANKHAKTDHFRLPRITGEFKPGYVYGNVKTHKEGYPLRPIISQIPLPT